MVAVTSAERGVAGQSVNETQLDLARAESNLRQRFATQQEFREQAAELRLASLSLEAASRIQASIPPPVFKQSLLSIGLEAGVAGLQGFAVGGQLSDAFSNPAALET